MSDQQLRMEDLIFLTKMRKERPEEYAAFLEGFQGVLEDMTRISFAALEKAQNERR